MKSITFYFLLSLASSFAMATPQTIDLPTGGGEGWVKRQHKFDGANGYYAGISSANDIYAWDMNWGSSWDDEGLPVYAVEDGCIYTGVGWGGGSYGQLLINHTSGTDMWSSGYLHMKNIVKKSGCVTKGEKIGEISRVGYLENPNITSPHLHFAVYDSHGKSALRSVNVNFSTVSASEKSPGISSFFDGTGSLIDPKNMTGCTFGCTKDYVMLHPHATPSTGLFQVVGAPAYCEAVELSGLQEGNVEIRSWNGYGAESVFYKLLSLPAIVPLKNISGWNLIALTTTVPIPNNSTRTISARCVTGKAAGTNVTKTLGAPTQFGTYGWGGNGSIIGHSNNSDSGSYGRTLDTVVTLRDKNTISSIQVTPGSCKNIQFTGFLTPFKLSWKGWDSSSWLGSKIIYNYETFTFPSGIGDWAVLMIQADATNENNSRITAKCY